MCNYRSVSKLYLAYASSKLCKFIYAPTVIIRLTMRSWTPLQVMWWEFVIWCWRLWWWWWWWESLNFFRYSANTGLPFAMYPGHLYHKVPSIQVTYHHMVHLPLHQQWYHVQVHEFSGRPASRDGHNLRPNFSRPNPIPKKCLEIVKFRNRNVTLCLSSGSVAGLPAEMATMPQLLREAGYAAHMVGLVIIIYWWWWWWGSS